MMAKTILFLLFYGLVAVSTCQAANDCVHSLDTLTHGGVQPEKDDIFIIFTSISDTTRKEGVLRSELWDSSYMDSPSIHFYLLADTFLNEVSFTNVDFNLDSISKIRPVDIASDKRAKCMMPKTFLSKIKPIDFDKRKGMKTREEALEFEKSTRGKTVWVIDRNDMTRDSIKLMKVDVLVQPLF